MYYNGIGNFAMFFVGSLVNLNYKELYDNEWRDKVNRFKFVEMKNNEILISNI